MLKIISVGMSLLVVSLVACEKELDQFFRGFKPAPHFPSARYNLEANPVTKEGFELGKKLFYDSRLSRNNTISCGTCHIQAAGFTHHGHDVSHGIDDRLGSRNSPPVMNLAWNSSFNWDGGIFDLDLFPISPITNPLEMDESVTNVMEKLKAHPQYPGLFKNAFGTEEITTARMMKALSQFMVMLVSDQSKYDSVQLGTANFSADESAGYALFKANCSTCHQEPLFTDYSFRDNGIGIGPNNDEGRTMVSLNQEDRYKFKVPSLRNLAYTKPYMHDGRMRTLETVVDHYSDQVKQTPNLDPALQKNGVTGFQFTVTERKQLLAFLYALNDPTFIRNQLFAE